MNFCTGELAFLKTPIFSKLVLQMEKAVKSSSDLLLTGEPGTGKTYWAKFLASRKVLAPLRIFEGRDFSFEDFFAYVGQSPGACVLIEEVDRLSFGEQSKLHWWLSQRKRPVQVIFTTRVNLLSLVESQDFRSDLFYRISVVSLRLPTLKDLKEDLPALIQHLVGVYQIIHNRPLIRLHPEALEKMLTWHWPGNFSELENVLEKTLVLSSTDEILSGDVELEDQNMLSASYLPIKKLAEVERDLILQTLKITDQNRTRAAEILGISIRTLRNKIHEYKQEGIL